MATTEPVEADIEELKGLPTLYEYSVQLYRQMEEESSYESLGPLYNNQEGLVYEGFLTHLVRDLNLPTPYFSKIRKELLRMECVVQLRRGGSTSPSRWLLVTPPTPELFRKMVARNTPGGTIQMLEQQIRALTARVNTLEQLVGVKDLGI